MTKNQKTAIIGELYGWAWHEGIEPDRGKEHAARAQIDALRAFLMILQRCCTEPKP